MDLKKFLAFAKPAIAGLVIVNRIENPQFTPEQLAKEIEGDIKHLLRKKLSWVVDILFAYQDFRVGLREMIHEAVTAPETEEVEGV